MRRRPEKDDREQRDRAPADIAGDRGPADQRRQRAGRAADHDVLRRPALQPDRIDEDVEGDRQRQQLRRHPVDRQPHDHDRADRQHDAESRAPRPASSGPAGSGRIAVRRITASMSRSYHMLIAPDAPAPTAMHNTATAASTGWRCPGATTSPTKPVKTTSDMTRGFRISM